MFGGAWYLWVFSMEVALCCCLASRILRRVLHFWKIYALSLYTHTHTHTHTYTHTRYIEYIAVAWVGDFSAWREVRWVEDFHDWWTGPTFHISIHMAVLLSTWNESKRHQNASSYVCQVDLYNTLRMFRPSWWSSSGGFSSSNRFFVIHFCAVDGRCHLLRLCGIGDEWMSTEHSWCDTDRGNWNTGRITCLSLRWP